MLFVVELLLKYATYFISREWSVVLCVASKSNTFFLIDDTEIGKSSSRHLLHHSWQPNNRIGILYTLWLTFNNWLNYDRAWYVFIRGYVVPRFDSGVLICSKLRGCLCRVHQSWARREDTYCMMFTGYISVQAEKKKIANPTFLDPFDLRVHMLGHSSP